MEFKSIETFVFENNTRLAVSSVANRRDVDDPEILLFDPIQFFEEVAADSRQ